MIQTLSDALAERGYDTLTPVQEAVTDPGLADKDLLVSAQTGSGKTVGFGLAIGPTILDDEGRLGPAAAPLALIVAPTRELAFQVMRELGWLYARAGARVATCVGGMDMRDERRALDRGAHIVVGTPGRLVDHIRRGSLDMTALRAVVLDEADEMLDLGFREDLEFMLAEAPADRRTLLFSATVPPMIAKLAEQFQREAVRVSTVSERSQHADISYQAVRVAQEDVENGIINLLRFHDAQNAIVFANTRATVSRLTARFSNRGFAVVSLSGELSQTERTHALQAMRDGRARVCVATDVAARGIDLPNLELVIHAELPTNTEGLLHRSGRTGRAGRKGISALIVPPKAVKRAERLLKFARITADWTTAPGAEAILRRDEERLLADPAWTEPVSEEEAAFATRLLDMHAPEVIAAAYLRLSRSRFSAPEDLSDPDSRAPAKERPPFGPATWVALSVGRNDRAEPRWLLPMLCRSGNLRKEAIGAIRIQPGESYVEIADDSLNTLLGSLGEGGVLEEGVFVRKLDGLPDFSRGYKAPEHAEKPRAPRPPRAAPPEAPDAFDRAEPVAGTGPVDAASDPAGTPAMAERPADHPVADTSDATEAPRPPRKPRAKAEAGEGTSARRVWSPREDDRPRPRDDRGEGHGPAKPRYKDDRPGGYGKPRGEGSYGKSKPEGGYGKPRGEGGYGKSKPEGGFGKPRGEGGYGKSKPEGGYGKPRGEGGYGKSKPEGGFGKPRGEGGYGKSKPEGGYGKPRGEGGYGKSKPEGSYGKPKPGGAGKPGPKPRPSASDTSKRFKPSGPAKPRPGGTQPPKRRKP